MKPTLLIMLCFGIAFSAFGQSFEWGDTLQYANDHGITALVHDADGNLFVATAGNSDLSLISTYYCGDVHVRKYTAGGSLLWDRYFWGNGRIMDLHVDQTGYLIAGGGYTNSLNIDGENFYTAAYITGRFLFKMSPDGDMIWKTATEPTLMNSIIMAVTTDDHNTIYVTGLADDVTALLMKYDPDGNPVLNENMGSVRTGSDIECDHAGHIYLCGAAPDYADFDTIGFPGGGTGYMNYLAIYDSTFRALQVFTLPYFTFDFSTALTENDAAVFWRSTEYHPATFTQTNTTLQFTIATGVLDTIRSVEESFGVFYQYLEAPDDASLLLLASTSTQNKILRILTDGTPVDSIMLPKLTSEVEQFDGSGTDLAIGGSLYNTLVIDTATFYAEADDLYQPYIADFSMTAISDSIADTCNAYFEFTITVDAATFTNLSVGMDSAEIVSYFWDFCDGGTSTLENPVHMYGFDVPICACLTITDIMGCSDTYCYTDDVPIEQHAPRQLTLYPNPVTKNHVTIMGADPSVSVRITTLAGADIAFTTEPINNGILNINIPSAPPGCYFITLRSGNTSISLPLIKE